MRVALLEFVPSRGAVWLAAALSGVILVACGDGTGPGEAGAPSAAKVAKPPLDTTYVPAPLRFASWAPPLETYDTSFTLVQGVAQADTIYFRKRPGAATRELFMVLAIPASAAFVDAAGKPLATGSTVKLRVKVDQQYVKLDFGPHGSTFAQKPAWLYIWWQNTDLQSRRGSDLQLWYRAVAGTGWTPLATQVSAEHTWIAAALSHFSNYAVAY